MSKEKSKRKTIASLTRPQILEICDKAIKGSFAPDLARNYNISISGVANILYKEGLSKHYRYKIHGKKTWYFDRDEKAKAELLDLYKHGYDDDEIAELFESNCAYIARWRSSLGGDFISHEKARKEGHHSTQEYRHGVETTNGQIPFPSLPMMLVKDHSKETNEVVIEGTDKKQVVVNQGNHESIVKTMKSKIVGDNIQLCIDRKGSEAMEGENQMLKDFITWREVAKRMAALNTMFYIFEYSTEKVTMRRVYQQTYADPFSGIVGIKLVNTIRSEKK